MGSARTGSNPVARVSFFSFNSKSAFYRSHVITEFFKSSINKGLSLDSVSNELGSSLFDTLKTMAIVDYVFFCCSFDYVEVLILTLNGTLVLIQCNVEEQDRESLYYTEPMLNSLCNIGYVIPRKTSL